MKVLIVGSGAREHALAWKLSQSPKVDALVAAPGNAGTARLGINWSELAATSAPAIAAKASNERIDLAVIGPESSLAAGVADALREVGIPVFGPGRSAARLESSKAFAKQFMARHGIPTARFKVIHDLKQAHRCMGDWAGGVVVKADGLAAGKGVVVCTETSGALALLEDWYANHKVPGGGTTVVLEETLHGREVSVMTVTDGTRCAEFAPACDYKRAGDDDTGPNTGGMGAYSPTPDVVNAQLAQRIRNEILAPTLAGLRADGIEYRGCLYAGLMITDRGPMVLEFNARFGDPETQVVLPRMDSDLFDLLYDTASSPAGQMAALPCAFSSRACVGVVLASEGYPVTSAPAKGVPYPDDAIVDGKSLAFLGGSSAAGDGFDATGGRVLTMCGLGDDLAKARDHAYAACAAYGKLLPSGVKLSCRSDIGMRAIGVRH